MTDHPNPSPAVERSNGEAELPPETDSDEAAQLGAGAREHARDLEQHGRQATAPTDPGSTSDRTGGAPVEDGA